MLFVFNSDYVNIYQITASYASPDSTVAGCRQRDRGKQSIMQAEQLLDPIRTIHEKIRETVTGVCESSTPGEIAQVLDDGEGDTIYSVDRISEEMLTHLFETELAPHFPVMLIAEGIKGGRVVLPRGTAEREALWRVIADPIDGTRSLMYQKRSGWILTGVAPNRGETTCLADIELAVQTELPLIKQHLCDTLWAIRGKGTRGERFDRIRNVRTPLALAPSKAADLSHGFSSVTRFFSGGRDVLAAIDDEIALAAAGPAKPGKVLSFEDQYLSTGGQLYELIVGHDRFQADLRPLLGKLLRERGLNRSLCCHPYDICTELIAREAGVIISDENGLPLEAPLNLTADVTWVGYANTKLRTCIEPLLRKAIASRQLVSRSSFQTTGI